VRKFLERSEYGGRPPIVNPEVRRDTSIKKNAVIVAARLTAKTAQVMSNA